MADQPRPAFVTEVSSIDMEEELGSDRLPVKAINLDLGENRKAFVFTMSEATRKAMTDKKLRQVAETLGGLVHPHNAVLLVLPGDADLRAWVVKASP